MTTTEGGQAAAWNTSAGSAWVAAQDLTDRMMGPWGDVLVDAVAATGARRVLDVGCGTGATTVDLARRLGPGGSVTGVDVSGPMLDAARRRAGAEGIEFVRGDAQRHPFLPGRFDAVASRFGVMFFDDAAAAFANLRAAVAEGGTLTFVSWRSPEDNPFMTTAETAAAGLLEIPERVPDAPGQFGLADRSLILDVLERGGWRDVTVEPVDRACTMPADALPRYVTTFGLVGRVLGEQQADDDLRARVLDQVRPAFDPFVDGDEVRFDAACWLVRAVSPTGPA